MFDVVLTQFVWDSLQVAGSGIAVAVWDRIKNAVGDTIFEKMKQCVNNQKEDEFKQELENILKYNKLLTEQLEQLRQAPNNHVSVNINNVSNITNTHGNINFGVVKF